MGKSTIKPGVTLKPNAKVGHVLGLPAEGVRVLDIVNGRLRYEDGKIRTRVEHEVQVDISLTPGIRFGEGCNAVKRLPVISTLQRIVNEVSRIVESFAGEF